MQWYTMPKTKHGQIQGGSWDSDFNCHHIWTCIWVNGRDVWGWINYAWNWKVFLLTFWRKKILFKYFSWSYKKKRVNVYIYSSTALKKEPFVLKSWICPWLKMTVLINKSTFPGLQYYWLPFINCKWPPLSSVVV